MAYAQAGMIEEESKDLSDYLDAFRRRRGGILLTALIIFACGLAAALLWPPTYKSAATILIEEQEIPADLVRSTVTSYATQRIQIISQRVMTRANLLEIIDKYGLYEDERKRQTTEQIITRMRADIGIDMISADVLDPRTGRPTVATIAFTLAFSSENPAKAQKVASELTSLYLSENLKSRTLKAAETYQFLTDEAKRLKAQIGGFEQQLAAFKEEHAKQLPELREINTRLLDRTEQEIDAIVAEIRSLEDRKVFLQGQLAIMDPYGAEDDEDFTNPATRLKALRTQYLSLSAAYSANHPDVLKLKREIEGLEEEVGVVGDRQSQLDQLDTLRAELATTRKRYSDDHPDVIRLKKSIASIESALEDQPTGKGTAGARSPDNPAYVRFQSEIASTERQLRDLASKRSRLESKLKEIEQRLFDTPQVESRYRELLRDLNNATTKYQEIRAKQTQAEIGQQLEEERKGERFTLIDPAALPEEPISPNRPAIVFLSLVFAIGGGVGLAAVGESLDSSVRGAKAVTAVLGVAPLATIPFRETKQDRRRNTRRKVLVASAVVSGIVIVLLLAHFFWTPLDVLWFKALRKATMVAGG